MVSVIIPIYHVEKYIARCIESVIGQTYTDWEMILVDDCGTDQSVSVALDVLRKHSVSRYSLVRHSKNSGLSAARNTGLSVAKGEYVYFLDSDDWVSPDALEEMMGSIKKFGVQCVIGGYDDCEDESGKVVATPYRYDELELLRDRIFVVEAFYHNRIPITAWNKLVSREFLMKNKLFFEEGIYHEDCLWTFQLFIRIETLALIPAVTYHYSVNPSSIMNQTDEVKMAKRVDSCRIVLNKMRLSLEWEREEQCHRMLLAYIEEMKNYMYRRLLMDGISEGAFKAFYKDTHRPMAWQMWKTLSLKQKIAHADMLTKSEWGYYIFMFVYRFLYNPKSAEVFFMRNIGT